MTAAPAPGRFSPPPGRASAFAGVGRLVAAQARQDWKLILPWVVLLPLLPASSMWGFAVLFRDDPATLQSMNFSVGTNPAFSILFGPAPDITTAEGFTVWRSLVLGCFFAALMAAFIVTRNARAQEDSGQAELVASAPVGRDARLGAALVLAVAAALSLGVLAWALPVASGADAVPMALLGAAYAGSGVVFASVAAVASQVASFARGANGLTVALLAGAYLARAVADTSGNAQWILWWTPFGWVQMLDPVGDAVWWPLGLCLAAGVLLAGLAILLQGRRDFGAGMLPLRPGRDRGGLVASVPGLVVHQQRSAVISWVVGLAAMGAVMGVVASSIGDLLLGSPQLAAIMAAQGLDAGNLSFRFLRTLVEVIALIAAVHGVQLALRLVVEEQQGRVDPLLATSTSRTRLMAWQVGVSLLAPAAALMAAGLSLGVASRVNGGEADVWQVVAQAAATVPALWVLPALALAFVGMAPGLRFVAWIALVAVFVVSVLGPTLRFPEFVLGFSPLWHVPDISATSWSAWPLVAIMGLVAGLLMGAFVGYRRRDIG